MNSWLLSILFGIMLGVTLFACVRLRVRLTNWLGLRSGSWRLRTLSFASIIAMIAIANGFLIGLRAAIASAGPTDQLLIMEVLFSLIGFALGYFLVTRNTCTDNCTVKSIW